MTSAELVSLFKGQYKLPNNAIPIGEEDVYHAGSLAQYDILADAGVIQRTGQLALIAGQAEYYYNAGKSITAGTAATPIVLTSVAHGFNTGDTLNISGINGLTGANGRFNITKVDADSYSLDGSVGGGVYTSGGIAYHDLMAAWELINVRFKNDPYHFILLKDQSEVEQHRFTFSQSTGGTALIEDTVECYQVREDYVRLRLLASPAEAAIVEMLYIRNMIPSEKLSPTVDPLLSFHYDDVLMQGTRYHLLNNFNDDSAKKVAEKEEVKFRNLVEKVKRRRSRQLFVRKKFGTRLIWR